MRINKWRKSFLGNKKIHRLVEVRMNVEVLLLNINCFLGYSFSSFFFFFQAAVLISITTAISFGIPYLYPCRKVSDIKFADNIAGDLPVFYFSFSLPLLTFTSSFMVYRSIFY